MQIRWPRALFLLVLLSLLGAAIYAARRLGNAAKALLPELDRARLQGECGFVLFQSLLGLSFSFLPLALRRGFGLKVPSPVEAGYFVFLFGAVFLGEIEGFYYSLPFWDTLIHALSSLLLVALVLSSLGRPRRSEGVGLGPALAALFAFCLALSVGVLWEIFEYGVDSLFGSNMLKWATRGGLPLSGMAAIEDTMGDLVTNAAASAVAALAGYGFMRRGRAGGLKAAGLPLGRSPEGEKKAAPSQGRP